MATSRAFSKFESYGMLETAASRGWKADAIEWFQEFGRLVLRRPRPALDDAGINRVGARGLAGPGRGRRGAGGGAEAP
jgi:hypothetical protein